MEKTEKLIYLDHAATMPVRAEAYRAMQPFLQEQFGNPGGIYSMAVTSKKAITHARRDIAEEIGADAGEIFFTSGGTEADNWALVGSVSALWNTGGKGLAHPQRSAGQFRISGQESCEGRAMHVISTAFEHHAVLETCAFLEKFGVEVTYLQPDAEGFISCDRLKNALRPETVLVSVMMANNEIGTIQPIRELAGLAHEHGCLFHADAVQTVGHLKVDVRELGVDMLSASGHKFGGPKGIGFLYVRQGVILEPFMHGGGQERGRRAGTENVAAIVGMAKALQVSRASAQETSAAVREMRDHMAERICSEISGVTINGGMEHRLPGNLNVGIEGVESESVLLHLNRYGICASGGAACTSSLKDPSHVLRSLGQTEDQARSAIRFTLGSDNTMEEIDHTVDVLKEVVEKLRELRR